MEAYAFAENDDLYEIIEGVKFVSPAPIPNHWTIVNNLSLMFTAYFFEQGNGGVFGDNTDIYFPDGNLFRPDFSVFRDLSCVHRYGKVRGVPDLVVEILSRSTARNDRGKKKDIYERNGVKEYWIVDQMNKSIEVYHLIDGKYVLDDIYNLYSTEEWDEMSDEERSEAKFEIKVSLFDDLYIDVRKVFRWWGEQLPVYELKRNERG